ncbi:unnamed protein product [Zymoseptoria tritici ST99CH_3D7]|uniref:Uncharacterized protein n=1 Tax=Zymoseptoria tritici (strain ST99CH_3D7) TaxID=1276538 RepID=A0A1X7RS43_ZYMT9|nr:unnamed protein product [Zymoseptoria tritici ST99CH_3D7]
MAVCVAPKSHCSEQMTVRPRQQEHAYAASSINLPKDGAVLHKQEPWPTGESKKSSIGLFVVAPGCEHRGLTTTPPSPAGKLKRFNAVQHRLQDHIDNT